MLVDERALCDVIGFLPAVVGQAGRHCADLNGHKE
jgi:hypothetical protein